MANRFSFFNLSSSRSIVLFALLASLAGLVSRAHAKPVPLKSYLQSVGYAPVAFEDVSGEYFQLDAKVNGIRVRFAVDSGSPTTLLDASKTGKVKTLGELHLKLKDSLLGVLSDPEILLLDELAIGGARFMHQPARKVELTADYIALGFTGVLGVDFLYRNFAMIDCAAQQLYFRGAAPSPELARAIAQSLRNGGYAGIPIEGLQRLEVDSTVEGTPLRWMVDTGSVFSIIEESERASRKLVRVRSDWSGTFLPQNMEGRVIGFKGIGLGNHQANVVLLPTLQFGERTWKDINVAVMDMDLTDEGRPAGRGKLKGLLGANFLVDQGAIIDFSSRTLWLRGTGKR